MSRDHELALDVVHNRTDFTIGLPPHITRLDLVGRVAGAGLDTERAGEVVDDLVATDHLFAWDWSQHDDRDSDRTLLAPVEKSRLREWARREGHRDQPHQALVGQLNSVVMDIDNDE